MHKNGIIHRDLNPTNIFTVGENKIKMLDFNVSKFFDNDQNV